ncbi:hypothetical protein BSNK01_05090 [Bacillaceae bacterium]
MMIAIVMLILGGVLYFLLKPASPSLSFHSGFILRRLQKSASTSFLIMPSRKKKRYSSEADINA